MDWLRDETRLLSSYKRPFKRPFEREPVERVLLLIALIEKWSPYEINLVREYVRKGYSLVVVTKHGRRPERLNALLKHFDICVGNRRINHKAKNPEDFAINRLDAAAEGPLDDRGVLDNDSDTQALIANWADGNCQTPSVLGDLDSVDTAAPALRRLEAVETGAKMACGVTHARGKKGARRANGGQHPWPLADQPQPGSQLRPSQRLLRRARASQSGLELTAQPSEPPCTDQYAWWCDGESPRGPTYVDYW